MTSARSRWIPSAARVLAILILLAPAAAIAQTRAASPALAALAPELPGWTLTEAPRSYFPDNLFEYINGAAESYLSYDFRELLVVDFEKKGTAATLTAEIYDLGLPVNAFGIFGSERYPENKPVGLGDLGYVEGEALNFLSGRYYVKMLAFGLGPDTESALTGAGGRIDEAIRKAGSGGGGVPALVRAFPVRDLVLRSQRYIKKNFLGYEFLHDGYVAAYASGGQEIEGFFIDAGSEAEAAALTARLLEALKADGQAVEKAGSGSHVRNRYGQHLFIDRVGGVICGAMRVPDGSEAAGRALLEALVAALRAPK
ncbi:MAG TPA: hypothetical protein P5119_08440 [Candidatus Aminicenantes bacterium]|nr:hypothetical protein [Candidatus Aminicenantes bacterium]HRY65355.1 hypothetical protein [Candidatus Aminicenantes bacterium]HRZ72177.1 hypothetical protein [Candidatus Aminicenantes bacterium]